ncbi:MAG TPA: hypothetical protein VFQ58_02310 [Flavisolibacter sp.]|jgi:hypothetical protein|nr:hypothetical protein [Flavisolibacter sp.]
MQETENWIKEKFDRYGRQAYPILSTFDCQPVIKGQLDVVFSKTKDFDTTANITIRIAKQVKRKDDGDYEVINYSYYTLYTKDITNVSTETNCGQTFIRLYGKISSTDKNELVSSVSIFLPWENEDDLLNRMLKAFKYLLIFNKPQEVF